MTRTHVRDSSLIDALEAIPPIKFGGTVWRVVREGRDPCQCSGTGGRWDDRTFEVLYTSLEKNGAIAELRFHLSKGQPLIPSRVRYNLFELNITLKRALKIMTIDELAKFGHDTTKYGQLSFFEKEQEYVRTQEIGEVAHFLGFDGLLVPNARFECLNAIIFCDQVDLGSLEEVRNHGLVDFG